eukprot:11238437-Karenia_brevis.AAC.1
MIYNKRVVTTASYKLQFVNPNDEMFKLEKRAVNMICGVPPQTFNKHDRFDLGTLGLPDFRSLFAVS